MARTEKTKKKPNIVQVGNVPFSLIQKSRRDNLPSSILECSLTSHTKPLASIHGIPITDKRISTVLQDPSQSGQNRHSLTRVKGINPLQPVLYSFCPFQALHSQSKLLHSKQSNTSKSRCIQNRPQRISSPKPIHYFFLEKETV